MALLFFEGFDLYPTAGWTTGTFWSTDADTPPVLDTTNPRNGTRCLDMMPGGFGTDVVVRAVPNSSILGCGGAWRKTGSLDSGNTGFGFEGSVSRVFISMDATGRFVVKRGTTTILTGTGIYNNGIYNYVELEYNAGAGTATLRVNNAQEATGPCTNIGVVASFRAGRFANPGITGTLLLDDVIVWDGTGVMTNSFPGDTAVVLLMPEADTAAADWTPTPAGTGFSRIDNIPPDAAQYIEAATVGDVSTFDVAGGPPSVFQVLGVAHQFRAQKTSAGDGNMRGDLITPFGTAPGANRVLVNGTYNSFQDIYETDPNTGQPFDPLDLAALQISYERTL